MRVVFFYENISKVLGFAFIPGPVGTVLQPQKSYIRVPPSWKELKNIYFFRILGDAFTFQHPEHRLQHIFVSFS